MRIAAIAAATVVAVGLYLVVAASFALPASMIAVGVLAIATSSAIAMVARSTARA